MLQLGSIRANEEATNRILQKQRECAEATRMSENVRGRKAAFAAGFNKAMACD